MAACSSTRSSNDWALSASGCNLSASRVAARAFKVVQGEARRRVIVIGPAHHIAFSGAAVENYTHYRTPLGDIPVDVAAVAALRAKVGLGEHDGAGAGEHSIEMVLPFLQRALAPGFLLVPVLVGSIDPVDALIVDACNNTQKRRYGGAGPSAQVFRF